MEKVLIAIDYNQSAQKVAEEGFSLAKKMKAQVTLLHVLTDPQDYTLTEHVTVMGFAGNMDFVEELIEKPSVPQELSRQFLDKLKLYLGEKHIQTILEEGVCAETILTTANKIGADVIVMGSHSRKWVKNTSMGNVTENVLQNTTVPVLIVPTKKQSTS